MTIDKTFRKQLSCLADHGSMPADSSRSAISWPTIIQHSSFLPKWWARPFPVLTLHLPTKKIHMRIRNTTESLSLLLGHSY